MEGPPATAPAVGRTARILVCDDVEDLLLVLKRFLVARIPDVEVTTTTDPRVALDLACTSRYDALLTDYHMPIMNGVELIMRVQVERPEMAFAIMSAYVDLPLSLAGFGALGVDCVLQKPMDPIGLYQVARYMVNTPADQRALVRKAFALHMPGEGHEPGHALAAPAAAWCTKGHANQAGANFCSACGERLPMPTRATPYEPHVLNLANAKRFRDALQDPSLQARFDEVYRHVLARSPVTCD